MRGPEAQRLGGPERGRLVDRLISWPEGRREVNERAKVQMRRSRVQRCKSEINP